MTQAKSGDTVTVQYIGTLDNGRIFDSTTDEEPLVFTIGTNQVFPALEKQVLGMAVGEVKNVCIPAAEAYGPRLDENILTVKRDYFPADTEIKVGKKVSIEFRDGEARLMVVVEVTETEVKLDGNHALAGLDLTLALRLDAIN